MMSMPITFYPSRKGDGAIGFLEGKVCLPGREFDVCPQVGETWECEIVADRDRFFIVRPLQKRINPSYGRFVVTLKHSSEVAVGENVSYRNTTPMLYRQYDDSDYFIAEAVDADRCRIIGRAVSTDRPKHHYPDGSPTGAEYCRYSGRFWLTIEEDKRLTTGYLTIKDRLAKILAEAVGGSVESLEYSWHIIASWIVDDALESVFASIAGSEEVPPGSEVLERGKRALESVIPFSVTMKARYMCRLSDRYPWWGD